MKTKLFICTAAALTLGLTAHASPISQKSISEAKKVFYIERPHPSLFDASWCREHAKEINRSNAALNTISNEMKNAFLESLKNTDDLVELKSMAKKQRIATEFGSLGIKNGRISEINKAFPDAIAEVNRSSDFTAASISVLGQSLAVSGLVQETFIKNHNSLGAILIALNTVEGENQSTLASDLNQFDKTEFADADVYGQIMARIQDNIRNQPILDARVHVMSAATRNLREITHDCVKLFDKIR